MVRSDRVTDIEEAVSVGDAVNGRSGSLGRLEEGWVVDVGRGVVPIVELASRGIKILPHLGSVEDRVVCSLEHLGGDNLVGHGGDLLTARPYVSKEDIVALLVLAERLRLEVEVDGASQSIGNDERRRG